MFRRSGRRFADKNMRKRKNRERVPIPKERNLLEPRQARPATLRMIAPASAAAPSPSQAT
jgi:hypothetical protein